MHSNKYDTHAWVDIIQGILSSTLIRPRRKWISSKNIDCILGRNTIQVVQMPAQAR